MALRVTQALSIALLFSSSVGVAQQHVHGQGQLLIAQQDKNWQLQLSLPAADALGFEHEPQTPKEKDLYKLLAERLSNNQRIIEFDPQCELQDASTNLVHEHAIDADNRHESHHGAHKNPNGDHDEHHHDHKEHHDDHEDVTADYLFSCNDAPQRIVVSLFTLMPSLSRIEVQWITETGQGSQVLTSEKPELELP